MATPDSLNSEDRKDYTQLSNAELERRLITHDYVGCANKRRALDELLRRASTDKARIEFIARFQTVLIGYDGEQAICVGTRMKTHQPTSDQVEATRAAIDSARLQHSKLGHG